MLNKILIGIFIAVFFAAVIYIPKVIRVYNVVHLFDEDKIVKKTLSVYKQLLDFKTIPNILKKNLRKSFNLLP